MSIIAQRAQEYGISEQTCAINTLKTMVYKMHSDYENGAGLNPEMFSMGEHDHDYMLALVEIDLNKYATVVISDLMYGGRSVGKHLAALIYKALREVQVIARVRLSHEGGLS